MSETNITFGMQLDGQRATQASDRLGVLTVGPQGLLDYLETQLGLIQIRPCAAQRTAAYRDCLARMDSPDRFYHASFAVDELGVAETLLEWRDTWSLHGWDGTVGADANQRLRDLADIEPLARQHVAASMGERLQHVLAALAQRRPPIAQLRLVDDWAIYPQRWQAVLERLPHEQASAPMGASQGFLGRLQTCLRQQAEGAQCDPLTWEDDGTVTVVQAQTRVLGASWLSRTLAHSTPTLLVASSQGSRLDAHLAGANQARHGLQENNDLRPALQVLPLVMELLWAPLDYRALLQFLTHPVCPIRRFARQQLASKLADAPGIIGPRWEQVLEDIEKHYENADAQSVRLSIAQWVESPGYDPDAGAPLKEVLDRTQLLQEYFRLRLGNEAPAQSLAARAGYAQCSACMETLDTLLAQGVSTLRQRQLQQVIEQATGSGTDNLLNVAQVGAHLAVSQPGAAIEPTDQVIWWEVAMPSLPANHPWSTAELRQLALAGVTLPDNATRLANAAQDWMRPVLAAKHQLTLVLAPPDEESHPLWQMIQTATTHAPVQALEQLLLQSGPLSEPVARVPLPQQKRWWKLPVDVPLAVPQNASFSSLELLLFNPYQWLLKYVAKLYPSDSLSLGDDFRLNGNLAHGLAERYFQLPDALTLSDASFERWFAGVFDTFVAEQGAVLHMAGRGADLATLRHRLRRALMTLRHQMTQAGVCTVISEKSLTGEFSGRALIGSADLVLTTANGQQAIVDMKWAGGKKYPEKLKANRHLQLAIYAELLRQESGSWPSVAYYILESAKLLVPDNQVFADAEVIAANPPATTRELWDSFIRTWKWRQEQIGQGEFEVALERIEATDASQPPEFAMAMEYLKEDYNDYLTLAGWEQ